VARHRFRPRYRGLAWIALGAGGALGVTGVIASVLVATVTGGLGVALGGLYLASPAWRLAVVVDDDGLEVTSAGDRRFRLAWADVVRVVASPSTQTCFVDGGAPERSLLVPGVGAPAPYDLEDRAGLYAAILARVPADKVTEVETIEAAEKKGGT
jgi:hypothetical protein